MQKAYLYQNTSKLSFIFYPFYFRLTHLHLNILIPYILLMIIDYLQIANLILFDLTYAKPSKYTTTSIEHYISNIKHIFLFYPSHNFTFARAVCFVFLTMLLMNIVFTFLTSFIPSTKHNLFLNSLYSFILILQIICRSGLSIPLMITLMSFYQCKDGKVANYIEITCESREHSTMIVCASFAIVFLICIMTLNSLYLHNMDPRSKLPFAAAHIERKYLNFVLKIIIAAFYVFYPISQKVKSCIYFALAIAMCVKRFFYTSYYSNLVLLCEIIYASGIFYISIFGLFANCFNAFEYTKHNYILIIFSSFAIGFVIYVLHMRNITLKIYKRNFAKKKIFGVTKVNILLHLIKNANNFKRNKRDRNILMSLLEVHRLICENASCKCGTYVSRLIRSFDFDNNITSRREPKSEETRKAIIDGNVTKKSSEMKSLVSINTESESEVESESTLMLDDDSTKPSTKNATEMINTLVGDQDLSDEDCIYGFIRLLIESFVNEKKAKNNSRNEILIILLSYIVKNHLHNFFKALFEMMKLIKKTKGISEKFIIFCLNEEIEQELYIEYSAKTNSEVDIEDVLKYNNTVLRIVENMTDVSKQMKIFWSIIAGVKSNQKCDLYSCALSLTKKLSKLQKLYSEMISNDNYTNQQTIYIYSIFLGKVAMNYEEAKRVKRDLMRNDKLRLSPVEQIAHENDELYDLFRAMDKVGIAIISGNINSLGKILTINHQLSAILGYDKDELLQDTVNKLCPSFIGQYHDEFMYRYLETAKKHIIDQIRIVFAVSKDLMLIPIFIFVRVIPNLNESVRFIGLIKKVKSDHPFLLANGIENSNEFEVENVKAAFIVSNAKGEIFGETKNTMCYFGIPPNYLNITNDKCDNAISINTLFPNVNFYDDEVVNKLKSNEGMIMKLDSRPIMHLFEDYKEGITNGKEVNPRIASLISRMDEKSVFREHHVLCFAYDLCFNEGQVPAKIFKMIKIRKHLTNDHCLDSESNCTTKRINNFYFNVNNASICSSNMGSEAQRTSRPIKYSTIVYSIDLDNDNQNTIHNFNDKSQYINFLSLLKKRFIKHTIPNSIMIFIIAYITFILSLIIFGIAEYILSKDIANKLTLFIDFVIALRHRDLHLALVALYFKTLILTDNDIIKKDNFFTREIIVNKIKYDMDSAIELNKIISLYSPFVEEYITKIDNVSSVIKKINNIVSINLSDNYTMLYKNESFAYLISSLNVKILRLLNQFNSLKVDNVNDLFYLNDDIQPKSNETNSFLRDMFYINENIIYTYRYITEKIIVFIQFLLQDISKFMSTQNRIYICIPPFAICLSGYLIFYFIFKSIATYKIRILRIFYLIERKFGIDSIKNCDFFLNAMSKTVAGTTKLSDGNLVEKDKYTDSNRALLTTDNLTSNTTTNMIDEKEINQPRWISFWIYDKMDENLTKLIKEKKNYISNELFKSKKKFWKILCLIYVKLSIALGLVVIYFGVTIWLDLEFERGGERKKTNLSIFLNRGWSFINLLIFSRELLFLSHTNSTISSINYSYSNITVLGTNSNLTIYDLFNLYLNQIDTIENKIMLLSTSKLKNSTKNLLFSISSLELDLNSDKYCSVLKEYDPMYYSMFLTQCEDYYAQNNGIKDNIKLTYINLKNNLYLNDENSTLTNISTKLNNNSPYMHNAAIYIGQSLLMEISTIGESLKRYASLYKKECLIRIIVFGVFLGLESALWGWVAHYIIENVNKDKLILTLLPFDAIAVTPQIVKTLKTLLE